LVVIWLA